MPKQPSTTEGAKAVWSSFRLAKEIEKPMTFFFGAGIALVVLILIAILYPFGGDTWKIGAVPALVVALMVDIVVVYRWATNRLANDPHAFDD